MIRRALLGFLIWLASSLSGHAFDKQQATACYPDAVRLCGAPRDYHRYYRLSAERKAAIISCMVGHAFSLSRECLAGFGR